MELDISTELHRSFTYFIGLTEDIGINASIPIISFLAVNGNPVEKTKILNWLCSDEAFDTYFNIELEESRMNGANIKRVFSNGK